MTKNKLFGKAVLFAIFCVIFGLPQCSLYAQGMSATDTSEGVTVETLSEINIDAAQVIPKEGNNFDVVLVLSNRGGAQAQIKYGVQLFQSKGDVRYIADEKIYDDLLSIRENGAFRKNLTYEAPGFLSGDYQLWITLQNKNGLTLASAFAGDINVEASGERVEIDQSSCYLQVEGEGSGAKYTPSQGVDIASNEKLIATCSVSSYFTKPLVLTSRMETFYRGTFGDKMSETEDKAFIILAANETKNFSLSLPIETKPQAYDVKVTLSDKTLKIGSNSVVFHYVLRGGSATIQNVILDKSYYKSGDVAKVFVAWTPSADTFYGARGGGTTLGSTSLEVSISSGSGRSCSNKNISTLSDSVAEGFKMSTGIELPITADCLNPVATVSLIDQSGTTLDKQEYAVISEAGLEKGTSTNAIIYTILILILIGIAVFVYFKKYKTKNNSVNGLHLLFIISMFGLTPAISRAECLTMPSGGGSGNSTCATLNFAYEPFSPTATMSLSGFSVPGCRNTSISAQHATVVAIYKGSYCPASKDDLLLSNSTYFKNQLYVALSLYLSPGGSLSFDVPKEPGSYCVSTIIASTFYNSHKGTSEAVGVYTSHEFKVFSKPPTGFDVGMRIKKGDKSYPVVVVPLNDPTASSARIKAGGNIWALKKFK